MIQSEQSKAGPFEGDDAATTFDCDFKMFSTADVKVVFTSTAGIESTLTLDVDYSVALNSDQDNDPGATITYPISGDPLATGTPANEKLTLEPNHEFIQSANLSSGGGYVPQTNENALDRAIMASTIVRQVTNRSIVFPTSDVAGLTYQLPTVENRASKALVFDASGNVSVDSNVLGSWEGTWAATTAYVLGDLVRDTTASPNIVYRCNAAHTSSGSLPISTNTDVAKWDLVVQDGATGPTGPMANIVEDTTPQLGGDLDLNGNNIDFPTTANISDCLDEDNMASDSATVLATQQSIKAYVDSVSPVGVHAIPLLPQGFRALTTNGAEAISHTETTAGRADIVGWKMDGSADEGVMYEIDLPSSWNEGTVTFRFKWSSANTGTEGITLAVAAVAFADGDSQDTAFGTAVTIDDANQSAAEKLYTTAESAAVTIAGSPGAGERIKIWVYRDVSDANDTMTEDLIFQGGFMYLTTEAAVDVA